MKTSHILFLSLLGLAPAFVWASDQPAKSSRVEVNFFEPSNFTDIGDSRNPSEASRQSDLDQIREYLVDQSKVFIPEGQRLEVTFTDIDRAGDFEPTRGPNWNDVRMVREIYPPRMTLTFRLVDANGSVIKEGKRELRDMNYLMKLNPIGQSDPLRHEKSLLDDWMRSEFGRARK
jgi:hypothetical protein